AAAEARPFGTASVDRSEAIYEPRRPPQIVEAQSERRHLVAWLVVFQIGELTNVDLTVHVRTVQRKPQLVLWYAAQENPVQQVVKRLYKIEVLLDVILRVRRQHRRADYEVRVPERIHPDGAHPTVTMLGGIEIEFSDCTEAWA